VAIVIPTPSSARSANALAAAVIGDAVKPKRFAKRVHGDSPSLIRSMTARLTVGLGGK
jgi:hypothetical protein